MGYSSRKILAGSEFDRATEKQSIEQMKKVIEKYGGIRDIDEVLTDKGSQFYANKKYKYKMGKMDLIYF